MMDKLFDNALLVYQLQRHASEKKWTCLIIECMDDNGYTVDYRKNAEIKVWLKGFWKVEAIPEYLEELK